MKRTRKYNAGFTLVELVVAMAMAVIVTAAATSVLLLGLRVNRQTADTASQQMTVRSLLNVMEGAAADGKVNYVKTEYGSWIVGEKVEVEEESQLYAIFYYDENTQEISVNGIPVLTGVYASNAILEDQLLSISIETKEGVFTTTVFCRLSMGTEGAEEEPLPDIDALAGREKFLAVLKSQYRSRGEIRYNEEIPKQPGDPTYFSEWYIDANYGDEIPDNGWNARTPWCACYVSWALVKAGVNSPVADHPRWFAYVDDFMEYFTPRAATAIASDKWLPQGSKPTAGDLIFFDWDKGNDPEHVGVVLSVSEDGKWVYTIEGNSAGRVTVRSYSLGDPRIIGYGVLPWS